MNVLPGLGARGRREETKTVFFCLDRLFFSKNLCKLVWGCQLPFFFVFSATLLDLFPCSPRGSIRKKVFREIASRMSQLIEKGMRDSMSLDDVEHELFSLITEPLKPSLGSKSGSRPPRPLNASESVS
jgi:hypothetical protein